MDFSILYAIQNLHNAFLDKLMLGLTAVAGSYGQIWLVIAAILLIFKKTRKSGAAVILGYALVYVLGQMVLKDLIARPRPCHLDQTVALLIERPSSFSCPSTHSAWAFAGATAIAAGHKKLGIPAFLLAIVIAFSRLYLFVHFPSDVLFGAVLGALLGLAAWAVIGWIVRAFTKKPNAAKGDNA